MAFSKSAEFHFNPVKKGVKIERNLAISETVGLGAFTPECFLCGMKSYDRW